ncbi:sugar-binding transcriptional regulator [Oceanobacillus profundus]|uniref:Sugar-binding transcriptional regulator n=1 Tax=Oceanobacillus profundus TaxID=372463 RepID=A0A417YP16_9BACI|nr:sugar-binding transcriptional regulator [Oceanobacillus profundus]MBR3119333.1 sugar-binding transcriptional regulator [Oceanobacillus sp.]MDO6451221.1 sugar-binding transcriptional regulator [Oceanobacillus profundus]PAE30435.1 transcriptional regulator [Paenibacillus sp. 7884-2]RHW35564.1 sugar-binding transcriptional regulator [Oceanobacillus profundus]
MSYLDDRRLMVKIANLYYEAGETQSTIAKKIGVSRSLISKYLSKSKELGIVEIIIHDEDYSTVSSLETKLENQYGLREAICVPDTEQSNSKIQLGTAASKYLHRMIRDDQVVGVSSGTTLYEVATAMSSNQHFPNVCFVPIVGGMGDERVDIHANHIVAKLAEALKATYHLLHAPVVVDSKETREIILKQPSIKNTLELGSKADIAIVGIGGTPEHSTMVRSYINSGITDDLDFDEIAGDICYNFINENGEVVNNSWNEKTITLELNKLKQIPLVVGVAAGVEKVNAIKAALREDLIDVLITDEKTARLLLEG